MATCRVEYRETFLLQAPLSASGGCCNPASGRSDRAIRFRTAVAIELPDVSNFLDRVHVQVGHDDCILVARTFCNDLAARVTEIALAVKLAEVPWLLVADAIDRADVIDIG